MDRTVLNKYKNSEEKLMLSKILDKIELCEKRNQIQITDFLDLAKQTLIRKFLNAQKQKNFIFFGGSEDAERKVVIFYPEKLSSLIENEKIDFNEWIKVLRIELPAENKGKYEHRIYLGALMKLGIKREKIGDIIVDEDGADIILYKDILNFLENNLPQLTRFQKSQLNEIKLKDIRKIDVEKEQFNIIVPSMRLDSIVSELAKCSRTKACEIIKEERVFINYELIIKQTKEIKEKDRITIRGKGRFEIKQIMGNTKKGNIIVLIEK